MRILYGIQGTGNGHISRARALVPELRAAGISPDFVFSGRERQDFFDMQVFGDDYRCFKGLSLFTDKGRLQTLKTLTHNHHGEFIRDIVNLDLSPYDAVISDFEPITAWAARLQGKPSIGISHQCAFLYNVPKVRGHFASKLLMRIFAPTYINIGLHWHPFDKGVLPPIIETQHSVAAIPGKIVVYMGFEAIDDVLDFLKPYTDYRFIYYAKVTRQQDYGHVTIKPLSTEFHHDLETASGVISNAGFELSSECLSLGKKLLVKPLTGQYEQLCNALALEQLQRGKVMYHLDHGIMQEWLKQPGFEPLNYPNTARILAQWVKQADWFNTGNLTSQLWDDQNNIDKISVFPKIQTRPLF